MCVWGCYWKIEMEFCRGCGIDCGVRPRKPVPCARHRMQGAQPHSLDPRRLFLRFVDRRCINCLRLRYEMAFAMVDIPPRWPWVAPSRLQLAWEDFDDLEFPE